SDAWRLPIVACATGATCAQKGARNDVAPSSGRRTFVYYIKEAARASRLIPQESPHLWSHSLASLTPAPREAVEHLDGPLLILAGPGSGKTRVITHRVANLLRHGVPARQILALTFTNKAADEMRSRLELLAAGEPVWMSTFHRFCSRLLRQYGP